MKEYKEINNLLLNNKIEEAKSIADKYNISLEESIEKIYEYTNNGFPINKEHHRAYELYLKLRNKMKNI